MIYSAWISSANFSFQNLVYAWWLLIGHQAYTKFWKLKFAELIHAEYIITIISLQMMWDTMKVLPQLIHSEKKSALVCPSLFGWEH